ncbi:BEL1-like homeodomain protein 7 [Magnolia sinica]|uniref:BEL1-like homeodomain protein 7 n=1 Tax=Magnolia sinica TaxID=86752 RepID=UPI002658BD55|nr:BEL1-like homeodomain protein 7 [Magnolia sinica]
MATYYSSSSDQRDVMPTLYLRDPGRATYQESSHPGNVVYLNYSSAGPYSDTLAGNSQSHQNNCVELPVPTGMLSQDSSAGASDSTASHQGILSNLVAPRLGEQAYGVWRDGRNETLFIQPTGALQTMQSIGGTMNNTDNLVRQSVSEGPQMDLRTQLGILHSGHNLQLQRPDISTVHAQGLSLSLSTQIPSAISVPSFQYQNSNTDISFLGSHQSTSGDGGSCRDDSSLSKQSGSTEFSPAYSGRDRAMHMDASPYGLSGLSGTISNSKYLKAAQQLLDEVVNVRKALRQESDKRQSFHVSMTGCEETDGGSKCGSLPPSSGMPVNPQESTENSTSELSSAERQDLQNKMTKLLAMLDEVDRRYKQYYHQMQIVVSSFDVIAGCGAAKPYTALALQTISRHFRCLRDAISSQIREARKSLGEPDTSSGKGGGISRLRFVDQQLRQQKALQQIGMIQQHAWRPQRGLPESSVSILRAWLFEHFLHPYPKDSDKIMLARQTGLTRSQVSNWFINARVRLWKPMVEEMYKEEIGDVEVDSNSSTENAPKAMDGVGTSEDREELQQSMKSVTQTSQFGESKSIHISDVEMAATTACFQNVGNVEETDFGNLKSRDQTAAPNVDACSILQDTLVQPDGNGRFMTYQMAELGRFGNGGVSLTLGLQHCDGGPPISDAQQNIVTVREEEMYGAASVGADAADYNCMNLGNQQHRFGSTRLLHDFVA